MQARCLTCGLHSCLFQHLPLTEQDTSTHVATVIQSQAIVACVGESMGHPYRAHNAMLSFFFQHFDAPTLERWRTACRSSGSSAAAFFFDSSFNTSCFWMLKRIHRLIKVIGVIHK